MILEGNERGHGGELARHLLNARDNEHVSVHTVAGFVAADLHGAFEEAEALSAATQCRKYLFSLSLNPPPGPSVPVEVFEATAARVAQALGLDGQPYALVFHEKNGRRHAHCVWPRIDVGQMKAINIAHYKRKLMAISKELYIEHGWDMPAGFKDRRDRSDLTFTRQEAGQANRIEADPKALKALFKSCWAQSDSKSAFVAALWEHGYGLAQGNRRAFAAVDAKGEVYSLSRWCGVKPKELRARLGDPSDLPTIDAALALLDQVKVAPLNPEITKPSEAALEQLISRQRAERDRLLEKQKQRELAERQSRHDRNPKGMSKLWAKMSGAYERLIQEFETEVQSAEARDRQERQALIDRHLKERRAFEKDLHRHDFSATLNNAFSAALKPDLRQRLNLPQEQAPFTVAELIDQPDLILDYIAEKKARFGASDVKRELANILDDPLELRAAIDAALTSDKLVKLDSETFTTRDFIQAEERLRSSAQAMANHQRFGVAKINLDQAIARQNAAMQKAFGDSLSDEQISALKHIADKPQIACVVGLAGAGKSTMLAVAHEAWRKQGIRIHGATLSGKAADGLEQSSNIKSRTLASLELSWRNGHDPIKAGDVLVVDEAGMIGTRQLGRITAKIHAIGAKLVLVGDPDQLKPIEAGQPFKELIDQLGAAHLTEIHRQKADWQKQASKDLAAGRIQQALDAYDHEGALTRSKDSTAALSVLMRDYMQDVEANGIQTSRLALAYRRKEVFALNQAIRSAMVKAGYVSPQDTLIDTTTGPRAFAKGDRLVFGRNDKALGLKNGMLATVENIKANKLTVHLDGDTKTRRLTIDLNSYRDIDHGYAVTIHKSQGATVDRAFVLTSPDLQPDLTYVAMTRHRESLHVYQTPQARQKQTVVTRAPSMRRL